MNAAAYSKQFSALQSAIGHFFAAIIPFNLATRWKRAHMSAARWEKWDGQRKAQGLNKVDTTAQQSRERTRSISIFGRTVTMPQSRLARIVVGTMLILLGLLGFLPILGFWMIPLGLLVLSYEFSTVRRWRRRLELWWAERRGRRRNGSR